MTLRSPQAGRTSVSLHICVMQAHSCAHNCVVWQNILPLQLSSVERHYLFALVEDLLALSPVSGNTPCILQDASSMFNFQHRKWFDAGYQKLAIDDG